MGLFEPREHFSVCFIIQTFLFWSALQATNTYCVSCFAVATPPKMPLLWVTPSADSKGWVIVLFSSAWSVLYPVRNEPGLPSGGSWKYSIFMFWSPSIYYLYLLFHAESWGSWCLSPVVIVRGSVHAGQVESPSHSHLEINKTNNHTLWQSVTRCELI